MTKLIREISAVGLSSREGCGNTVRNVTADPLAGICEDEVFDPTPYVGAYVRYFVRHPTTQLMPRKVKTAFDGTPRRARDLRHPRHRLPRARARRRARASRCASAAARRSCRASRRRSCDFVTADDGEYLKIAEACFRIFDQPGLAARQPRPRPHQGARRPRRHRRRPRDGRGGAARATGSPSATSRPTSSSTTRRLGAPGPLRPAARARTATRPRSTASRAANVVPQRQDGLLRRHREDHARRPDARSSSAASGRSCATSPAATRARRCSRTSCCAGCATRRVYDVWQRLGRARPRRRRRRRDHGRRQLPRHRQLQARHHRARWASTRPSRSASSRWRSTDPLARRIHIKMSGCPNGCSQHHIANIGFYGASIKVGEHTIPAYVTHIGGRYEGGEIAMGTRLKVRLPAKRVPDAVERFITLLHSRAARARRRSTTSPTASARRRSRTSCATSRCRSSSGSSR